MDESEYALRDAADSYTSRASIASARLSRHRQSRHAVRQFPKLARMDAQGHDPPARAFKPNDSLASFSVQLVASLAVRAGSLGEHDPGVKTAKGVVGTLWV